MVGLAGHFRRPGCFARAEVSYTIGAGSTGPGSNALNLCGRGGRSLAARGLRTAYPLSHARLNDVCSVALQLIFLLPFCEDRLHQRERYPTGGSNGNGTHIQRAPRSPR